MASVAAGSAVTPVQKVIQLMNGMLEKGKAEKHDEEVQFAAYKQFCDDTRVDKERAIKEANNAIEKLNADMKKYKADAARLAKHIAKHEKDIAVFEGDLKASTKVRQIEKDDYTTTHKDYSESIDALGRAVNVLKKQSHDRKQAAEMLLQLDSIIPASKKHIITAFLQQDPSVGIDVEAPQANAYEFQSGGVVEMLQKLEDKFEDERAQLEKDEANAKHAFQMLSQDLSAQIEQNDQAKTEKSGARADKLQSQAKAKGDLQDTTQSRDADKKYLEDLVATCEQKAGDFENRQQLRADELVAIEKAIEIISGGAVSGASDKHLPKLLDTSFVQLRSEIQSNSINQEKALAYISRRGRELKSRVLTQLASGAGEDPFKKIKKLIQDMIVKLMEEANEEAEHKGWCDTELATNEATRKEKTAAVEKLHAEIDQLEASTAKLGEQITELTKAVSALDKAVAKATSLREEEKATNKQTVKDAKEAQAAVAQALEVLQNFYAKAGEATSLMQNPEAPEVFDEPYKGMQSENGGVVGMIEVIQSDFARLEAETTAGESQSQKEYDEFMDDSAVDKTAKNKDIEHKTAKKQDQQQALQEKRGDLEGTQKELDAALAYFDKLKPSCIDSGVSYEDRVQRRQDEIESLQEALRILNGEDMA